MIRRRWLGVASVMLFQTTSFPAASQELSTGTLLVATGRSGDPDLARTAILLIRYDEQGAVGLIVNRPWEVPLSRIFPSLKNTNGHVYDGGPVVSGVRALLRSRGKLEDASHLFADVYMISNVALVERTAAAGAQSNIFRVYTGYTGWSRERLQGAVANGLWRIVPADAATVFDPNSEAVWPRLAATRR